MTIAKSEFGLSLDMVRALLAIEGMYNDPPNEDDKSLVEGLRGGAIVLLVGAFENYLKVSTAELLEDINLAQPPCSFEKLPTDLQVKAVYLSLETAMKGRPWEPKKERVDRLPDIVQTIGRLHLGKIVSDVITQTAGNPDASQVKSIYEAIGLRTVLSNVKRSFDTAWGSPTAVTFVGDMLDAIVRRRHDVAHTASILNTSRNDVNTWVTFMTTLVGVLDESATRHMERVIARAQ